MTKPQIPQGRETSPPRAFLEIWNQEFEDSLKVGDWYWEL